MTKGLDELVFLERRGQQDHSGRQVLALERLEALEAVLAGHPDVEHQDVRTVGTQGPEGLLAIASAGHHPEVQLQAEESRP